MQRLTVCVSVESVYVDPPAAVLRRGLDYRYAGRGVTLLRKGFECIGARVESARRMRRGLRRGSLPTCPGETIESITSIECDAVLDGGAPPSPAEIILTLYAALLYHLVERGELRVSKIARLYETASCSVVRGGFLWNILEERLGRRTLRLSTARLVEANGCERVHLAIAPVYEGRRIAVRRARCYIGVRRCSACYEVIVAEEFSPEQLDAYTSAVSEARRRLLERLGLKPTEPLYALRLGAGAWPFTSLAAVAWLNGLASGEALETIFAAYRRCGGPRLWPPRGIDMVVERGGGLLEAGVVRVEVEEPG